MYPLDVTMPQAGCCVAGGLEFGAGSILGASSSAGAMETLSAACQRTCRSHQLSTGQPCTQCRCRSDAQP